jgi:hypothetical protein
MSCWSVNDHTIGVLILKARIRQAPGWARRDAPNLEHGEAIEAHGSMLRQLQAWLKEKDPGFGGLVRHRVSSLPGK